MKELFIDVSFKGKFSLKMGFYLFLKKKSILLLKELLLITIITIIIISLFFIKSA